MSEWLKAHLPDVISLVPQERAYLDDTSGLYFDIDLVLCNTTTGEFFCVLDTKYKDTITLAPDDIAQMVVCAQKMGCQETILVFPCSLPLHYEAWVGDIRVRSLSFSLDADADAAGHHFMRTVLGDAPV